MNARMAMAVSVAVAAALGLALVLAVLRPAAESGPAAIVPTPKGPFLGGELPEGLDRAPAPRIRLLDHRGKVVDTDDLQGKPYVVTFVFTNCRDVCPAIGRTIAIALEQLGAAGQDVGVVAVSVDPRGDRPESVDAWIQRLGLPDDTKYLLGPQEDLEQAWADYYAGPQPADEKQSLHTASIWLVDAGGRLRTKFSAGLPVLPSDLAHDLRLLLAETGN